MATKSVSIRIERPMLVKLDYVAAYEGRSLNSHVLVLIRDSITAHEDKHGEITGTVPPQSNVKPSKKS